MGLKQCMDQCLSGLKQSRTHAILNGKGARLRITAFTCHVARVVSHGDEKSYCVHWNRAVISLETSVVSSNTSQCSKHPSILAP
jgi:hypothetical protein